MMRILGMRRRRVSLALVTAVLVGALLVLAPTTPVRAAPTVQRPITDFLNAQEYALPWTDLTSGLVLTVDCFGVLNERSGLNLATSFRGTVAERPLADGSAEVTVVLHTSNALITVNRFDPVTLGELLFGHEASDVATGADPALAMSTLKFVFINTAPGADLPDLITFFLSGGILKSVSITVEGAGTFRAASGLPDGTPGRAQATQVGLFMTHFQGATADAFPAEHIRLQAVGS